MKQEEERKKIIRARVGMMMDTPFFGHIIMQLPLVRVENDPFMTTMGTDGYHLFYSPEFIERTPDEHLRAILAHEVGHLMLNHLTRRNERHFEKWNIACDFAVNALIEKDGTFVLPENRLLNHEFGDNTAEWIYSHLPDPPPCEDGVVVIITMDSHSEWEKGDGGGKGEGDEEKGNGSGGKGEGNTDSKDGENNGDGDLETRVRELVAQAATSARMKGQLPAHIAELVQGILQPKLDWKAILQDMIVSCAKSDFSLFPCNKKHLYRGFILPGITGSEIKVAVVIDTSGSIDNKEMQAFMAEIKGICDAYDDYTIYLRTCDTVINQKWELHPFDPIPDMWEGRGGTDFREALEEAANLDITSLVYLTDGYGDFPDKEPRYPVIWVSTTDHPYPWGQVIRLPIKG